MITRRRFHRLRDILLHRQPDLTVLMEHVHKAHNFSAILRTGDAVGIFEAHAVLLGGRLPSARRMSAAGSARWIGIQSHPDIETAATVLKDRGFRIYAAHLSDAAIDFREPDYTAPTAFLLGQEKDGVSEEARALADQEVIIPMIGMVSSLNVSVAAALLLYEAQRQRQNQGLYKSSRLDEGIFRRTLFEWAYPRQAALCRQHQVPYPALDEDGKLLGPLPR
ncbi:MAG: tRNA (guanosine(18)-2'-O)-methyltransferase TrmH [Acidobacteriota bacterium]|nr:tRNA (guanosine(18)-2'-O)-methyltransferase TrmH [Acidobacteriota bacterium]